jgi:adenine phosphoribosyltransferase
MALDLKKVIREVPDFPKPGILFYDITTLLQNPPAFRQVIDWLVEESRSRIVGAVVGIESRGFIFGAPLAHVLGVPFIPVRKPGKLPAAHMSIEYSLEYGESQLDIHSDAMAPGTRAVIIDDLLATGGTALATAKLVELIGGVVALVACAVELTFLQGRERLANYDVATLVSYDS